MFAKPSAFPNIKDSFASSYISRTLRSNYAGTPKMTQSAADIIANTDFFYWLFWASLKYTLEGIFRPHMPVCDA